MLRVFHHYFSGRKALFFLVETSAIALACALGASALSMAMAPAPPPPWLERLPGLALLAAAFVVAFQFLLYLVDLYDLKVAAEDRSRGARALRAGGVAVALVGLIATAVPAGWTPSGALLGGALGAVLGSLAIRAAMRAIIGLPTRVLIVGQGERALELVRAIEGEGENAFQICAMVEPSSVHPERSRGAVHPERRRGNGFTRLSEMALRLEADAIITALDEARGALGGDALLECRMAGLKVYDTTGFFERVLRRLPIRSLRASDLAYSDELDIGMTRRLVRRVFDLVVSVGLLFLTAPLMLVVAALIKLDSQGPIFYRQERVGLHGRVYRLWKFRSMRPDAEKDGATWALPNDERITRIGRFIRRMRIDEIPQVFNVLIGEMSFVGPRPERPIFVAQLKAEIPFYALREAVKPGITGWAQIRYPYGASVDDARNKLEFDLYYVKNGSLVLDLAIIFHTVRHVLLGRGAR